MITAEGCQGRRQRLWDRLAEKPDWIIITDPQHLTYFANYVVNPFIFRGANSMAVLILGADGSSTLIVDSMLRLFAAEAHVGETLTTTWYDGKKSAGPRRSKVIELAIEHIKGLKGSHWGYEAFDTPGELLLAIQSKHGAGARLTPVDGVLQELKRRKDPDELATIQLAMDAGDAGHAAALAEVKPGMTELDAWLIVQRAAVERVQDQVWVYGDFATGPRSETGGQATNRKIERGDLVLLDFSVVVRNYRGDFANTFVCGAKPTDVQRQRYEACIAALEAGEQAAVPGASGRDIDRAVKQAFASRHLEANFKSHSGHGLGLGHPDPPFLTAESTDELLVGDVIAIEPSQMVKGEGGMRFERNYVVREGGVEALSHLELRIEQ